MNKHIVPYERVSHFIAVISCGSRGVSWEQWAGGSSSDVLLLIGEIRSKAPPQPQLCGGIQLAPGK